MSVRAYRVNEIKHEPNNAFNLWHDKDFVQFLERECDFWERLNGDGCGLSEIPVAILQDAIKELSLDPELVQALEEDIRWAEINKEDYIQYYCY